MHPSANVSLLYRRRLVGVIVGRFLVAFLVPFFMILRHGDRPITDVGSALPFQVLLGIGILNVVYLVLLRSGLMDGHLVRFGLMQITADVLIAGGVTYLTGGIHSWFSPLLFLPVLEAGWLVSGVTGVLCASLGSIALAASAIVYHFYFLGFDYQSSIHESLAEQLRLHSPPLVDGSLWLEDQADDLPLTPMAVAGRVIQQVIALYIVAFLLYAGALRGREVLVAGILERIRDGVLVFDRGRRILFCNEAARKLLGIHPRAILEGMPVDSLQVAEGQEEILLAVRQALRTPGQSGNLGIFHGPGDGDGEGEFSGPSIDVKVTPVMGLRELEATVVRLEDATERLRSVRAEQRVDRLRSAGIMATGLAHEIRNPLAAIRSAAQELRRSGATSSGPALLDLLIRESDRLDGIVGNVLQFARPSKPVVGPVDVREVMTETLDLLPLPAAGGIAVDLHVWPGLQVWAEAGQLRQLFVNLGRNAVEAMGEGPGTLVFEAFEVEEPDRWVCIRVRDTGCGIPVEARERVGTPFFTTKDLGTGMGLPIAMKIVEEHGGSLELDGLPGQGTVVTILLPATRGAAEEASVGGNAHT